MIFWCPYTSTVHSNLDRFYFVEPFLLAISAAVIATMSAQMIYKIEQKRTQINIYEQKIQYSQLDLHHFRPSNFIFVKQSVMFL